MILLLLKGFRDPVNAIECLPNEKPHRKNRAWGQRVSDIAATLQERD